MRKLLLLFLLVLVPARPAKFTSGSVTCPASGTKQVSTVQQKAEMIIFQGLQTNAGRIYIGDTTVTVTSAVWIASAGTTTLTLPLANAHIYDLSQIYFACTTSTDTLGYVYLQ